MYVRGEGKQVAFDAIVAVEGKFEYRPSIDKVPTIEVLMCNMNSKTGTTYGTCPFRGFSPKTIEAFMNFLKCAEQDFGEVLFEGGVISPFGPVTSESSGRAETGKGLPTGLGEG